MFSYKEKEKTASEFREKYLESFEKLVETLEREGLDKRKQYVSSLKAQPEKYRKEFAEMLGWPLTIEDMTIPKVTENILIKDEKLTIIRIQAEVLPEFFFSGLLFIQNCNKPLPLVIVQHGGDGTPELCSDMYLSGSTNYNNITKRILKQGVHVFASQMLLWHTNNFGIKEPYQKMTNVQVRMLFDNRLKQYGSSIAAVELYCLKKMLNYLESQSYVQKKCIGMAGLSYGGFYSLFAAALDVRIKATLSCSFFNNRGKISWADWVWKNAGNQFFDSEIAMLVYPRKLYLCVGKNDELFDVKDAREEMKILLKYCGEYTNWISFIEFDGTHEFIKDDELLKEFINTLRE